MNPLELAAEVVLEKDEKKADEKADIFLRSLLHTKEGRELRRLILPRIARGIGIGRRLG